MILGGLFFLGTAVRDISGQAPAKKPAGPVSDAEDKPSVPEPGAPAKTPLPKTRPPASAPKPAAPDAEKQPAPAPPVKPATPAKKPATSSALGGEKLPEPKTLSGSDLRTSDGVSLYADFYPSKSGKNAVPVILLHGYQEDRSVYAEFAVGLQSQGHAVLVPDLRGHGESTEQRLGNTTRKLEAAKMENIQFLRMVDHDMETFKRFLRQKNNAGELNIDKLCIVGSGMSALVALNWTAFDWSWPSYPGMKQGQYVKALVLLSPQWSFRGLSAKPAPARPDVFKRISLYLMVGRNSSKARAEADKLYTALERLHPEPAKEEQESLKTLFFKGFDVEGQGSALLGQEGHPAERFIARFIELRLVNQDYPWQLSGKKSASSRE